MIDVILTLFCFKYMFDFSLLLVNKRVEVFVFLGNSGLRMSIKGPVLTF